jgi:hypothetical protein
MSFDMQLAIAYNFLNKFLYASGKCIAVDQHNHNSADGYVHVFYDTI